MIIFRVETPLGVGPYNYGPGSWAIHGEAGFSDIFDRGGRAPSPTCDGFKEVPRGHLFGFASVEQCHAWFIPRERKYLAENGFTLAIYKVDGRRIKRGRKQLAFHPAGAKLIERKALV